MSTLAKRAVLLVAPLLTLVVAFMIYAAQGPSDSQVYLAARIIGMVYGAYATTLIISWIGSARLK